MMSTFNWLNLCAIKEADESGNICNFVTECERYVDYQFNKRTASGAIYARSSVIFPHRMASVRGRLMMQ